MRSRESSRSTTRSPDRRCRCAMVLPRLGMPSGTPTPRKLSAASSRTTWPNSTVATTRIGATTGEQRTEDEVPAAGAQGARRFDVLPAPQRQHLAAGDPREDHPVRMEIRSSTFQRLEPSTDASRIASRIEGKASCTSATASARRPSGRRTGRPQPDRGPPTPRPEQRRDADGERHACALIICANMSWPTWSVPKTAYDPSRSVDPGRLQPVGEIGLRRSRTSSSIGTTIAATT